MVCPWSGIHAPVNVLLQTILDVGFLGLAMDLMWLAGMELAVHEIAGRSLWWVMTLILPFLTR
jgi:hypothetical protein